MSALAHVAGPVAQCGSVIRQRCIWCGAALIDQDLSRTAVAVPDPAPAGWRPDYPTWPVGQWIERAGPVTSLLDWPSQTESPPNSCMRLDPEVTG